MSQNQTRDTDETDETDAQAPGEAINGYTGLYPRQVAHHRYVVLSLRNDGVSGHHVALNDDGEFGCTCEDYSYNQEGSEICDHIAVAIYEAPKTVRIADEIVTDLAREFRNIERATAAAEDAADALEGALVNARDAEASDAVADATDEAQAESPPGRDVDPMDAADRLQDAFDDVVEDMQVQAHEGWVWIKKGYDTPDELPGPGSVDPFVAFLQEPDHVDYVHDDHDLADSKPGEYWSNIIAPEAVDEYISEVLE
jgi:hypothetical protein